MPVIVLIAALSALAMAHSARATHPCTSPLILDLNGDGIRTIGLNWSVLFDINADGIPETIGWTFKGGEEAFLWLDLNRNRMVDNGAELFGNSTLMPDGTLAANGFEALAVYDQAAFGGNEDGLIDREDLVFEHLRLWVDANGDGTSQQREISTLRARAIEAISLDFAEVNELDGAGNLHQLRGGFVKRVLRFGRPFTAIGIMDDVVFVSSADGAG